MATRTTLVFVAIGGAYTLLAHLCGATLPPEPYYIFAFIVSIQALIHSNSESVARWMRGASRHGARRLHDEKDIRPDRLARVDCE